MKSNKLSKTETMKAIISTKYGSPDILELQEVNKPIPKDNEILIKVIASSVTTADGMMRTGKPYIGRLFTGLSKPKNRIPGTGFAGIVEAIGSSVKNFKVGDEVFGENIATFGTNAEFVCVPEDGVVSIKPRYITFEEAAPICDGALTSMNFLKTISKIKSGQKVLIIGASGSLGT
ncbi:MAG: NAD(P)-dependent alcohol dehydrogenase, partial [Bacteroidota bacterium]